MKSLLVALGMAIACMTTAVHSAPHTAHAAQPAHAGSTHAAAPAKHKDKAKAKSAKAKTKVHAKSKHTTKVKAKPHKPRAAKKK